MSLAFHWFLPTYGDSRNLVAGGHGTPMSGDRPATLRVHLPVWSVVATRLD
ncbi:MAG: hypothetical protein ACXVYI_11640 [Mycobacterium sp.]